MIPAAERPISFGTLEYSQLLSNEPSAEQQYFKEHPCDTKIHMPIRGEPTTNS